MRSTSGLLYCACLACLFLAGCQEDQSVVKEEARTVRVVTATLQTLGQSAQGTGRIEARYVSQLGFEVAGRLIKRYVDVGDTVTRGQLLAEVSAVDFENKVTAAQSDVAAANAVLVEATAQERRKRILLEKGVAPPAMYDAALQAMQSAEASVKAAEANLRIAQNQLSYTRLLADKEGVVTAIGADPGQVVSAGQMIVEISDTAERDAVFDVSADHTAQAKIGMAVQLSLQSQPDVKATGTIREISPHADATTGTYKIKVAIASPPSGMRLGSIVTGRVDLPGDKVISLPAVALLQSGIKPQVWIVSKDDKVRRREVDVGQFNNDSMTIKSGVTAGESVVIAGVNTLADDQTVKPLVETER